MRTLIAIPCMSMVHTGFMTALLSMQRPADSVFAITEGSLIYSARNLLARQAVEGGFDRILWLDSDMRPPRDLLTRLSADMDKGMEFVCGLYFSRVLPSKPVIYRQITAKNDGTYSTEIYDGYPKDSIFPIAAAGFGAVMMTTRLYTQTVNLSDESNPFMPLQNLGEDLAFCWRMPDSVTLYCDSRIKVPHIGLIDYTEDMYED